MIRPIAALQRQVQEMFHEHLAGIMRWEDIVFRPLERIAASTPDTWDRNGRGQRIRPERPEGKFKHRITMEFGIWELEVEGPNERPPLGWIRLTGYDTIEGPLDPETWKAVARAIKQNMIIQATDTMADRC